MRMVQIPSARGYGPGGGVLAILAPSHGGRAERVEYADRGHAMLPEQPMAVAEAVITFLRKH